MSMEPVMKYQMWKTESRDETSGVWALCPATGTIDGGSRDLKCLSEVDTESGFSLDPGLWMGSIEKL